MSNVLAFCKLGTLPVRLLWTCLTEGGHFISVLVYLAPAPAYQISSDISIDAVMNARFAALASPSREQFQPHAWNLGTSNIRHGRSSHPWYGGCSWAERGCDGRG